MPKNILIVNSSAENNQPLFNLFEELKQRGHLLYLLSASSDLLNYFNEKRLPAKKSYFGPKLNSRLNQMIFFVLLPILFLLSAAILLYYKKSKKITTAICLNWNEKIIIAPIAKILKIKTIWLERPDLDYKLLRKPLFQFYKLSSKRATLITFTNLAKIQLKNFGFNENNIKTISPGIRLNQWKYQDTIFDKLAQTDKHNHRRKYFAVGAVADLNPENSGQKIKNLLEVIKVCLTIIPDLQLIVVGGGAKRKNLIWLAKKMEIDNLVWFVGEPDSPSQGEHAHLKKWLDNFDIFVVSGEIPGLTAFEICLNAMAAGLPVIGPGGLGFEDIIHNRQNGILVEANNNEMLARQIIALYKNKRLRLELGENARKMAGEHFTIDKMAEEFEKII
jgi:glycosyltransferase involved in cell wall biosynthesis